MKKTFAIRILAGLLAIACLLALGACGKSATVEDFVNSDAMQKQLETLKSSLGDEQALAIDLKGEDNKLIYTFTYPEELSEEDISLMKDALESALDSMSGTFEEIASSLKKAVNVENPVVVVTYVTKDGTEIYSKEFSPAE